MSQLRAGAILSYFSIMISVLIALIYTPIMIRLLGQSEFGLYSVIGSLAAYFSVMDLGLGNAMVRFTARNRAVGSKAEEARVNGLFLFLYTIIGIITILIGIFVHTKIELIFGGKFTELELEKAKLMIIILTINFSISFPMSIFNSLMKAYERFVVEKLISIIRIILVPIITLPIIYYGYGAVSMVVITTAVNIGCLVFSMIYCIKKLEITIKFGRIDISLLKQILGYSFFVFLAVIVDQINWQTDQIILGAVKGTVIVAVYAIAMQFVKLYIQLSTSISGLFLPKVSMLVADDVSNRELSNLMIKYGRVQYIIVTFILCGFVLFGLPFVKWWAGPSYEEAYYIVLIIMIPLTIPLIQNIGITILYAKNKQGFRSIVLISIAVTNILISIPISKVYGAIGVAFVTSVTLIIGNIIVMNIYYSKKIGLDMLLFWKNIIKMSVVLIILLLIGGGIINLIPGESPVVMVGKAIVYLIIHIIFIYKLMFNKYEKELFNSFVNKFAIKKFKAI